MVRRFIDTPDPGKAFLTSLSADSLAELLSILTGESVEWVKENYHLAGVMAVFREFAQESKENILDAYTVWWCGSKSTKDVN